ncbi:BQ5605_C015g07845 [Microbotryum silenes-dioicae]|uniref:BQ5605_C015g07845 protein n=1 Tax=Microbotryum silenes-dioicae TaxID=796604 RepID=A0A2X0NW84_9BASI|nr:BQ5605_C015g07845 [Microbotryum silenes-dioicae]
MASLAVTWQNTLWSVRRHPIRLPSALGDSFPTRPCGVFCILSQQAWTEPFAKQDRQILANLADEAGRELLKVSQERAGKRGDKLLAKYEELKNASAEADLRASTMMVLYGRSDNISHLSGLSAAAIFLSVGHRGTVRSTLHSRVQIATGSPTPSNPSTPGGGKPPTTTSSTASLIRSFALDELYNLSAKSAAPVFPRRLARTTRADPKTAGVNVPAAEVSDGIKSCFDLSTRMICESLDFDFCRACILSRSDGGPWLIITCPIAHTQTYL